MQSFLLFTAQSTVQLHSVPALPAPHLIGQFRESDNGSLSSALVPYWDYSGKSHSFIIPINQTKLLSFS